jgi:hypothetical protein
MKLWLLLVAFGQVGGTWGPLPYDMDQCQRHASDMIAEIHEGMAAKPDVLLAGKAVTPADINTYCIEADERPELGSRFPA